VLPYHAKAMNRQGICGESLRVTVVIFITLLFYLTKDFEPFGVATFKRL
jgi:hypothetical protein